MLLLSRRVVLINALRTLLRQSHFLPLISTKELLVKLLALHFKRKLCGLAGTPRLPRHNTLAHPLVDSRRPVPPLQRSVTLLEPGARLQIL